MGALVWRDSSLIVLVLLRSLHVVVLIDQSCNAADCRGYRNDPLFHKENGVLSAALRESPGK